MPQNLAATAATAALLLAAAPAVAAEESHFMIDTAGDLARLCAAAPEDPNFAAAIHMCQGYLVGVHHMHTALAAELDTGIYCIGGVEPVPTRDEVTAAFSAWALETPGVAEREALDAVLDWAAATFPCE